MPDKKPYRKKFKSVKKLINNKKNYNSDRYTSRGEYVCSTKKLTSGIIRNFVDIINNLE